MVFFGSGYAGLGPDQEYPDRSGRRSIRAGGSRAVQDLLVVERSDLLVDGRQGACELDLRHGTSQRTRTEVLLMRPVAFTCRTVVKPTTSSGRTGACSTVHIPAYVR